MSVRIIQGDVLDWAAEYDGPKFHGLLCDPPYHLYDKGGGNKAVNPMSRGQTASPYAAKSGFMGKKWDGGDVAYRPETWAALAEHLHPGAFGMAFASARGWHRLAVAIEDAGLRIHPSIFGWAYGSGFPKATRIDTQVDKAAGMEQKVIGTRTLQGTAAIGGHKGFAACAAHGRSGVGMTKEIDVTQPATPLAQAWQGHRYGLQAMKPALEPIIVFQKPYEGKPVECITATGAGALNIDGGRIGTDETWSFGERQFAGRSGGIMGKQVPRGPSQNHPQGRWPANFCLVHHPDCRRVGERRVKPQGGSGVASPKGGVTGMFAVGERDYVTTYNDPDGLETIAAWECVESCPVRRLGEQSGERASGKRGAGERPQGQRENWRIGTNGNEASTGTAARFFFQAAWNLEHADPVMYQAKAARRERDAGLEGREEQVKRTRNSYGEQSEYKCPDGASRQGDKGSSLARNPHPTVKPLALTRWLATLLLPPAEYAPRRLLVPFAGVASEMIGAHQAGWDEVTGIELGAENCEIGEARLAHWLKEPRQQELPLVDAEMAT